jgi:hypothetical protein
MRWKYSSQPLSLPYLLSRTLLYTTLKRHGGWKSTAIAEEYTVNFFIDEP